MPLLIHKRPDGTDKNLTFGDKPLIVGRLPESEISVRDSFISRVHCGISHANSQFTLKDLGSTNGTYRNGARVFECSLATGDKIQVGNTWELSLLPYIPVGHLVAQDAVDQVQVMMEQRRGLAVAWRTRRRSPGMEYRVDALMADLHADD